MPTHIRSVSLLLLGIVAVLSPIMRAQQPPATPPAAQPGPELQPEGPIHTLHVYMDLIQVPVLVLDSELDRLKPIEPAKFLVSLDSGPAFHPRHVRQEGDDPITLGILLDPNGALDLMPRISAAISALAPGSLHPRDHVTVFVMDCKFFRSLQDVPADPDRLKTGVDSALEPGLAARKIKHPPPCPKRVQLWDAMAYVIKELGDLPGRRVLLAVTDGNDHGSNTKWNDLRSYAQFKGVAVFGFSPSISGSAARIGVPSAPTGRFNRSMPTAQYASLGSNNPENPFNAICQLSGGMVMSADPGFLPKQLAKFATLIRERYILEFSRARNDTPGEHSIVVTINKNPNAYIRPSGVVIVMRDAALDQDPDTIQRDSTDAPEFGTRKPLKPSPR